MEKRQTCRCGHEYRSHDHGHECEQQSRDSNGIIWICNCPEFRQ